MQLYGAEIKNTVMRIWDLLHHVQRQDVDYAIARDTNNSIDDRAFKLLYLAIE